MKSKSFWPYVALYTLSLAFCGTLRIWLKLTAVDAATGFYNGGGSLPLIYNLALGGAAALIYVIYLLRSVDRDYPVLHKSGTLALLAMLNGMAILFYQFETLRVFSFGTLNPGVELHPAAGISCASFGTAAAFAFCASGISMLTQKGINGVFPLTAGVWQIILLVTKFNGYKTLATVSDNLMAVLFMLFCAMFLVGHARTLGGLARGDGRNYAIPAGLCASLFGFLLVIPNWAWMALNHTLDVPAPLLGGWESVFVFVMSVYALWFVRHIFASIEQV